MALGGRIGPLLSHASDLVTRGLFPRDAGSLSHNCLLIFEDQSISG